MKITTNQIILLGVGVCLVCATAGKPWVNKSARERVGGYRAHVTRGSTRASDFQTITFYALGDWGKDSKQRQRVAAMLRADVQRIGPREVRPFVLGLGDNLYPHGLKKGWPTDHVPGLIIDRNFGEVFERVRYEDEGLVYHVVLGNHDYQGDIYLWETFVEGRYEGTYGGSRFVSHTLHHDDIVDTNSKSEYDALLAAAEKGEALDLPQLVPVPSAKIAVIAIDTNAIIRLFDKVGDDYDEDNPPPEAVEVERHFVELRRLLETNKDVPWVFVMGHHPIASHGVHGGHRPRPLGLHLEAVVEGTKSAIGLGDIQDLSHPAYRRFADRLYRLLAVFRSNVVYISGHEHSLQILNVKSNVLQVISGAGSKLTPVTEGKDTVYKNEEPGFARFDVSGDDLWIEMVDSWSVNKQRAVIFKINR